MLSVIIIARNEAKIIPGCLESIKNLADEIILVDSGSTDNTISIAKNYGAKIITTPGDYSTLRNLGLSNASGDWIFYIDADERVTPELAKEVSQILQRQSLQSSYKLYRKNIIFGHWITHGGYWPDPVHRLFQAQALRGWTGKLHESPHFTGPVGYLKNPLVHYTARSITAALSKSKHWSVLEAQLLYEAKVASVTWWKIIKAFKFELARQFFFRLGFLDGFPGLILAYIRAYHQASILINLWQLQNQEP